MTNFSSHFVIFSHVSYVCVLHFPKQFYKLLGKVPIIDTFDSFFCFSLAPSPTPTFFFNLIIEKFDQAKNNKRNMCVSTSFAKDSVLSRHVIHWQKARERLTCLYAFDDVDWKTKYEWKKNLESCYECLHSKHKLFHGKWKRYEERDPICGENFTFFFLFVYPPSKSCAKLIFIV